MKFDFSRANINSLIFIVTDVSHLPGYQYSQPQNENRQKSGSLNFVGTSMVHQHNDIASTHSEETGTNSIFKGITSYEAPLHAVSETSANEKKSHGMDHQRNDENIQIHREEAQVIDLSGRTSSSSLKSSRTVYKEGPPEITKSIYIHEAQEDAPDVQIQERHIEVRPKKHFNIIFVKVPSESRPSGSTAPIYPQVISGSFFFLCIYLFTYFDNIE